MNYAVIVKDGKIVSVASMKPYLKGKEPAFVVLEGGVYLESHDPGGEGLRAEAAAHVATLDVTLQDGDALTHYKCVEGSNVIADDRVPLGLFV